ncbi:MAG TPA: sugar phosphate nucleotidyltransferase [Acidimicrobiales bacterium]|nr:sugar phosphate nucleotidyltransferase [Acidimicrobiales bacterium]
MKAVILAGGEGTRLRPLTTSQPKPMLPMANQPMAAHIISLLKKHGFDEIIVTVAFLANTIRTYFGDGSELGVRIDYATEETALGTAGSVRNAREQLDERFLVISGDVLTDIELDELVRFHDEAGAEVTLALKPMENPLEFGIVITDDKGRIERFLEKPTWGRVFSDRINTGIYVLDPVVLDHIAPDRPVDFSAEVFPELLEAGHPLYGFTTERYWEDVGTLDEYLKAHDDILEGKVAVDIDAFPLRQGVWVGEGAEIDPAATIEAPTLIGDNCRIGPGARIGAYTVLGANVRVSEGAVLERSVVHDNCFIGAGAAMRNAVVGRSCELRQGVNVGEGAVVGDHCRIGRYAVITAGVKVYPNKRVESNATVTSSIIWETRGARALFGRLGVSGLANVDLSPELATRVAMAYAATLPRGASVTTSRDSSRAARMLKRAVIVGLNAAGLHVEDLEAATLPLTRFHIRSGPNQGGVTVGLDRDDPQSVVIRFLDADGVDVDEATQKTIERLFYREDLRRVLADEIGDIGYPAHTVELYTAALTSSIELEPLREARLKLVLDYAYGSASFVMPSVLAKLGADVLVVNPLVSTVGFLGYERSVSGERLSELVHSSGAHLGAVIASDGEQLTLVDDTGMVLSDGDALLAVSRLVAETTPGARVAVPVSATWRLNEVLAELGAEVVWTQIGTANLMEVALANGATLAASTEGGFAFPRFLPAYDAVATLVHVLAMLVTSGRRLSELRAGLPPVCVAHEQVLTPLDQKGAVMRWFVERARLDEVVLIDGVKVIDASGWTLVVPDTEEPFTHVFAEADDEASSRARAGAAAVEIRQFLASNGTLGARYDDRP